MSTYRGIERLAGDGRSREVNHWTEWLKHVQGIRRKFQKFDPESDPFGYNEATSVAALASAAALAGYLALTEYVAFKTTSNEGAAISTWQM